MSLQEAGYLFTSQERLNHAADGSEENGVEDDPVLRSSEADGKNGEAILGPEGNQYYPLHIKPTSVTDTPDDHADDNNDDYEHGQCGLGSCHPQWLQRFMGLKIFVLTYGVAGIWMLMLPILLGSQITSIERHLGLSSSQTGMILSSNDIGYLITALVGSHFGKYTNIPHTLSASGVVFGTVGIVESFGRLVEPVVWKNMTDQYGANQTLITDASFKYLCNLDSNSSTNASITDLTTPAPTSDVSATTAGATSSLPWGYWLLLAGAVIGGMVKSYRVPLLTYYVDENVPNKEQTSSLLGGSFTIMVFGPAFAFFLGAAMNSIPMDLKQTSMSKHDQRWIGAWWLGFLITGIACLVTSLPIMLFPRRIRKRKSLEKKRTEERKMQAARKMLLELPKSMGRIFRRPLYVLAVMNGVIGSLAFSGWFAFSQKYLEHQFNKTAQQISLVTGITAFIFMSMGTFGGGYISTKLKMGLRGHVTMASLLTVITLGLDCLYLVFGCDNSHVVGVTSESTSPVSTQCGCNDDIFLVCGDNNVDYKSPCLAGCMNSTNMIFSNCSEIDNGKARPGLCDLDCPFYIPFMTVFALGALLDCMSIIPGYMLFVRSVLPKDQPVATGTGMVCQTLIGMLPSPILFGKIVDSTCRLWHPTGGYCMLYDRNQFRLNYNGLNLGLRVLGLAVIGTMVWLVHRQHRKQQKEKPAGDENAATHTHS